MSALSDRIARAFAGIPPMGGPKSTLDAIMYEVRTHGLGALNFPDNQERLSRCDDAGRSWLNEQISARFAYGSVRDYVGEAMADGRESDAHAGPAGG